ncbi:adenosylcobinamide-phosphate synthase CbiB [Alicyclobacillus macrosporangiidus]|uniref:adenosylcobinamide-phosphate synthase CbiB n=1 Tax=Alicyclobacillus macrosporangiidus TaxID=392015 RepID=UPI0004967A1A|nr:adenosylcobinamide-phosphate synthase CbiB [Alicyclobacillus macrosporangiidus]
MNPFWAAAAALALDRVVGDPAWLPHPVVAMGRWIGWLERRWNRRHYSDRVRRALGAAVVVTTLAWAGGLTFGLLWLACRVSPALAALLNIVLTATTVAWRGLRDAGRAVYRRLREEGLDAARCEVARYVGRDTAHLPEPEVVRAAVETVAENLVDAVVSPLFFACLLGAPGAMMYRAANTLDSMLGHRDDRFWAFGWSAARLDDVLNFIPARLTAGIVAIALAFRGLPALRALRVMRRDAGGHPSPNAGIPEAMMAGGLGVQLGGWNVYHGVPSFRALMGDPLRTLEAEDIPRAVAVLDAACAVTGVLLAALGCAVRWGGGG